MYYRRRGRGSTFLVPTSVSGQAWTFGPIFKQPLASLEFQLGARNIPLWATCFSAWRTGPMHWLLQLAAYLLAGFFAQFKIPMWYSNKWRKISPGFFLLWINRDVLYTARYPFHLPTSHRAHFCSSSGGYFQHDNQHTPRSETKLALTLPPKGRGTAHQVTNLNVSVSCCSKSVDGRADMTMSAAPFMLRANPKQMLSSLGGVQE